ncbi:unnamed protein product, partial [Amoebophrya sp. A25]
HDEQWAISYTSSSFNPHASSGLLFHPPAVVPSNEELGTGDPGKQNILTTTTNTTPASSTAWSAITSTSPR